MKPSETFNKFSVGLTGGIGSGKSLVADQFAKLGAAIIDTDLIAHQLTGAGGAAMPAIRETFGDSFLTSEGALDRAAMRTHVFSDPVRLLMSKNYRQRSRVSPASPRRRGR